MRGDSTSFRAVRHSGPYGFYVIPGCTDFRAVRFPGCTDFSKMVPTVLLKVILRHYLHLQKKAIKLQISLLHKGLRN